MSMQLGFIMPGPQEQMKICQMKDRINALREDQLSHFESLLRSWRLFENWNKLGLLEKALKRTLRDRP